MICFGDYKEGEDTTVMSCSSRHRFHEACLNKWFERSRSCPLYRYELPAEELPSMAASEDDNDARYSEWDDLPDDPWLHIYDVDDNDFYFHYYLHIDDEVVELYVHV
ncbi:hypothetical protein GUJ93_ZPchr0005g14676 [Zizania palustris]|uniref:RING-type domain-containing protein n=1 Tax=Zizania palustris TaxID=103762 RepID=A0A8J5W088_ZIZPA|nr:hypothetical protein GUJ93_ZPchr0005g14676 [Zizania palustris]